LSLQIYEQKFRIRNRKLFIFEEKNMITVSTSIHESLEKIWDFWTNPKHIIHWNFAGEDWHCPKAENDLQVGGKFNYRMEAKDGSMGFDFEAIYTNIMDFQLIEYKMDDDRKVSISLEKQENSILITEKFDPENENPLEMQQQGWQMILDNFKKYVEGN
jgi:uncharacterized protein YndB with AHSA1/START domain